MLAAKKVVPASAGTFRTDTPMFTGLLLGVILIVGALTFFPAVSLGPIVEQLLREVLLMIPGTTTVPTAAADRARHRRATGLFDREILGRASIDAVRKLDPRVEISNPVMFVVLIGAIVTLIESIAHPGIFTWSVTIWLFLTVLFANFAEAVAEGRGKAQADTLRKMRADTEARLLNADGEETRVAAATSPGATSSSARPETSSLLTARSSKGSPRSTSRRSPANRPR